MATTSTTTTHTFKLVLVGDAGVGKSTYVHKLVTEDNHFEPKYIATMGVMVHSIKFETTDGQHFCFNVWDTAGQEKLGGLCDGYYIGGQCAIAMHDLTAPSTLQVLRKKYIPELNRVCKGIPIVMVGNKSDSGVSIRHDIDFSTKNDDKKKLLAPFLHLAHILTGNHTLELKPTPSSSLTLPTPKLSYKAFFP